MARFFRYPSYLGILRRFKGLSHLISIIYHLVREKPANRKSKKINFFSHKMRKIIEKILEIKIFVVSLYRDEEIILPTKRVLGKRKKLWKR